MGEVPPFALSTASSFKEFKPYGRRFITIQHWSNSAHVSAKLGSSILRNTLQLCSAPSQRWYRLIVQSTSVGRPRRPLLTIYYSHQIYRLVISLHFFWATYRPRETGSFWTSTNVLWWSNLTPGRDCALDVF